MLLALTGCGYSPVAPEDRPAGFANTPDGLLVFDSRIIREAGGLRAELQLVDVATGEERIKPVAARSAARHTVNDVPGR